jgi:hypothetical protein
VGGLEGAARYSLSRRQFVARALTIGATGVGAAMISPFLTTYEALATPAAPSSSRPRAWVVNADSPSIEATFERPSTIARGTVSVPLFNVKAYPYSARGDGTADDGPAIQAAINDAASLGRGIVYLPPGNYLLGDLQEQTGVRYYLLDYYSGVYLVGAGLHLTLLIARGGLPDQTRIISAHSADRRSLVSDGLFQDFSVQGNAPSQPDADSMVGISNVNTDGIHHVRVRVASIKGTPQGEGTCYDSYDSMRHSYRDCQAVQDGIGSLTGSGFGSTQSMGVSYERCQAMSSGLWMGFSTFKSSQIEYWDCHGALNNQRGLNCEQSGNVRYVNCQAGGRGTGNHGDGIYVFQSHEVQVADCVSTGNDQSGLVNNGSTNLRLIRGQYAENSGSGLTFMSEGDWAATSLEETPAISANVQGSIAVSGRPVS